MIQLNGERYYDMKEASWRLCVSALQIQRLAYSGQMKREMVTNASGRVKYVIGEDELHRVYREHFLRRCKRCGQPLIGVHGAREFCSPRCQRDERKVKA
ncbi:hypothetical protein [Candidatus Magnetobacterium casense]|uniref:Uncharacterized protein n=1 Tax=Candidatus Magnetobacterium casense TaxID=1455061 RepID=A0ABS6RWQ6_9BACT|nr:hypothetical protein [Candidatus Magnetobacterium casensis]MBV6341060.1 hypothetical protein [Candidatus Magnetobacterium casensis]